MKRVAIIDGLSCDECVENVRSILYDLPGVTDVRMNLASGTAEVESDTAVDHEDIRIAIEEVGYTLRELIDIF